MYFPPRCYSLLIGEGDSEDVQDGPLITARPVIFVSLTPRWDDMIRGMAVIQTLATQLSIGFRFILDLNLVSRRKIKS